MSCAVDQINSFCTSENSLQHDHVYDIEDNEQQPHSYNEDSFAEEQEICEGKKSLSIILKVCIIILL